MRGVRNGERRGGGGGGGVVVSFLFRGEADGNRIYQEERFFEAVDCCEWQRRERENSIRA